MAAALLLGACAAPAERVALEGAPTPLVTRSEVAPIVTTTESAPLVTSTEAAASPMPQASSEPSISPTTRAAATPDSTFEETSPPEQTAGTQAEWSAGRLTITGALTKIPTKGRAPKTGYERDVVFGPAWQDVDRNGCDTRNDVLARDLTVSEFKLGTRDCVVLRGTLKDPYTGKSIAFVRGQGTSMAVQIDHVVALSDAWQKGAQQISQAKREALANDPLNLLAVDGPSNSAKSDGDAATWLPKNKAYRCQYVARQAAVKLKYGLWMTKGEKDAISRIAATCPQERIPSQ